MEFTILEVEVLKNAIASQGEEQIAELSALQLATVGGGVGEFVYG